MNTAKVLIINGPNTVKGVTQENSLKSKIQSYSSGMKIICEFFRANSEGEIIDKIEESDSFDGYIINPGSLCSYAYSLKDTIENLDKPFVEIFTENIFSKGKQSVLSEVCYGVISGFDSDSYLVGINALREILK